MKHFFVQVKRPRALPKDLLPSTLMRNILILLRGFTLVSYGRENGSYIIFVEARVLLRSVQSIFIAFSKGKGLAPLYRRRQTCRDSKFLYELFDLCPLRVSSIPRITHRT